MHTELNPIIEELQRQAKVCATVAEDIAEEALTGASCEQEKNAQEAKDWEIKAKVWLEAEAVVRGFAGPTACADGAAAVTLPPLGPCI